MLQAEKLSFAIGNKTTLDKVTLAIPQGNFTAIIGPNGAGKTTLLNCIDGDVAPTTGCVYCDRQPLARLDRLSLARRRAVLPQTSNIPLPIKARDIVALGRAPYRYQMAQRQDKAMVDNCMKTMEITHLAEHRYATLSGGEQQRVHIARTFAQIQAEPKVDLHGQALFLDEPTNHLDILHQYRLMYKLKALQQKGLTIVTVMHDLSLALQFAEKIILMCGGKKIGDYTPPELVQSDDLSMVYKMDIRITWDEKIKRYWLAPQLYNQEILTV